jgi:hypothetical protein
MARSQRLSEAEVRRCFRLVREICEAGDDAQAWRLTMAQGVSRLVGANKCIVGEERVGRECRVPGRPSLTFSSLP